MFTGGQLASISSTTELPDAAWAFVEQLTTPEAEAAIATLNFAVPAALNAGDAEVVTSNPASTFAYANLDASVFEGGATNWLELRGTFGTELDQAITGQKNVTDVLASLASQSE